MATPDAPINNHMHLLYRELKRIATGKVRAESDPITMGTTGLVHEAYLRLASAAELDNMDKQQFIALMAKTMRRILIDRARSVSSIKRGNRPQNVMLQDHLVDSQQALADDILLVDQVLEYLQQVDEQMSHVVVLRYFGGLTIAETASVMALSARSVNRYWVNARNHIAVLVTTLEQTKSDGPAKRQGHQASF